jgi:hypothetical protein
MVAADVNPPPYSKTLQATLSPIPWQLYPAFQPHFNRVIRIFEKINTSHCPPTTYANYSTFPIKPNQA